MTVIDVYTTWLALQQLVNVQQNGQIPPSVFTSWYNEVNAMLHKRLAEEYQTNQVMSDLLSPFNIIANVLGTEQRGQNWTLFKYPADYQYFLNGTLLRQREESTCFFNKELPIIDDNGKSRKFVDSDFAQMKVNYAGANVEEQQIRLIDTSRWASCLNHATKAPSWDKPKMTQFKDGFKVAPKGIIAMVLSYLKTPRNAVFAYTISVDDIVIYDAPNSVQLEWSNQALPLFLAELQKKYAVYVGDPNLFAMAEQEK